MTHGPIRRIRAKFRRGQCFLTVHAREESWDEGLDEEDVEACVASGRIVRIEQDRAGRRKYTIEGHAEDGRLLHTVCRVSDTGRAIIVITVYLLEDE